MSRKYPRPIPHYRPVSQKAYDTFVRQIFAIVPKDNRCADMIDALDKYLDGDRETYASHLGEHTAITFEMLRFEIDKAIERSVRARRPRRRKIARENTAPKADLIAVTPLVEKSLTPASETIATPVTSVAETMAKPETRVSETTTKPVTSVAETVAKAGQSAKVIPAGVDFTLNADLFPPQTRVSSIGLMSDFVEEQLPPEPSRHRLPRRLRRAVDRAMQYK